MENIIVQKRINRLYAPGLPSLSELLEKAVWHEHICLDTPAEIIHLLARDFTESGCVSALYEKDILLRESIFTFAFQPSIVFVYSLVPGTDTRLSVAMLEHRIKWNGYKIRTVIMAAIHPADATIVFRIINELFYNHRNTDDSRFLKTRQELMEFLL